MPRERVRRRRRERRPAGGAETLQAEGVPDAIADRLTPPPSVYEVRCYDCDTSFAPGTKNCVHCGRRVGRSVPIVEVGPGSPIEGAGDDELRASPARSAIWVLTAIVMLIGSAMRACQ